MPPTDKSLLRQQTKDKINDMLFKDDLEDSFIFKDEADSDLEMFREDKKRG
jgi:hypothetical protein